jgi:hypothetical protein
MVDSCRGHSLEGVASWRLRRVVELLEEGSKLGEAFGAELLLPGVFHFGDGFADGGCGPGSPLGESDSFGALVVRVGSALEVAEVLELAE